MTENYNYCYECREMIRIGLDDENDDYAICKDCMKKEKKNEKT